MASKFVYRPEIDGLRAIAVLPVILFHAGFSLFSGGFIGVDVFFVISGYLITSIILRELEAGAFTFASFYERRARRILPALFLVMLACVPFAWMWMMPAELKTFSNTLVSVLLFASNIRLWQQAGYFDTAAELKPLLHTWSLAVEEQFYIIFPIVLLLIWRFGRKISVAAIAAAAIISLVLCEYASRNHPIFNFYWAVTRAWELLAGALCAFVSVRPHRKRDNSLSAAGLLLILGSIFWFDNSTRFPSLNALLPVAGASLVILFASSGTIAARLLSMRALVGVGLISYSAYLWHQPLFAFARIRSVTEPSMWMMAALALLVFLLAWLTWKYVETPFRTGGNHAGVTRVRLMQISTATAVALAGFGVAGHVTGGFPNRVEADLHLSHERLRVNFGLNGECENKFTLSPKCKTKERPSFLLWGDSFAMHLADMLKSANPPIEFVQMTISDCSPLIAVSHASSFRDAIGCQHFNDQVFDWLQKSHDIKLVIISSPFAAIVDGKVRDNSSGANSNGSEALLASKLRETIRLIRATGREVYVVAPPPTAGFDIGQCLLKSKLFNGENKACQFEMSRLTEVTKRVYRALESITDMVPIVWPHKWICSQALCKPEQSGVWIYRDAGHLSHEGSAWIGRSKEFSRISEDMSAIIR